MAYNSTVTSKGTVTIPSSIRKVLGIKPGQKLSMFINKNKNVEINTGISFDEFEKLRDEILKNIRIPDHLRGLTARELRNLAAHKISRR